MHARHNQTGILPRDPPLLEPAGSAAYWGWLAIGARSELRVAYGDGRAECRSLGPL